MSQRFQIEDIVEQDHSGVIFRALDTQTQQHVALRRFFPFGPNGGGLREDEQNAYNGVVEKLTHINHPALRSVIAGGCDPVDRFPYIATEWIVGTPLRSFITHRHLKSGEATQLLIHAFEICEQISSVLNEEAVWVETDLKTIIIGDECTGRGMSFWIVPLRSLAKNDHDRSLNSIVRLTEQLMGWEVKSFSTDKGLEGWLSWLEQNAKTATLAEAREKLTIFQSAEPIHPIKSPGPQIVRPPAPVKKPPVQKKKKKQGNPLPSFLITLATIGICFGSWTLFRKKFPDLLKAYKAAFADTEKSTEEKPSPKTSKPTAAVGPSNIELVAASTDPPTTAATLRYESPEEKASRLAIDMTAATQKAVAENNAKLISQKAEIAKRNGIFTPSDHELLIVQNRQQVTVEGIVRSIDFSSSKKTMYLLFASDSNSARGKIRVKGAPEELTEQALASLMGKKIHLKGEVQIERIAGLVRPVILIESRSAIQAME
jgi:hypothetical protein